MHCDICGATCISDALFCTFPNYLPFFLFFLVLFIFFKLNPGFPFHCFLIYPISNNIHCYNNIPFSFLFQLVHLKRLEGLRPIFHFIKRVSFQLSSIQSNSVYSFQFHQSSNHATQRDLVFAQSPILQNYQKIFSMWKNIFNVKKYLNSHVVQCMVHKGVKIGL